MEALRCWSESASWGTSSCRRPRRLRLRRRNRRRRARPAGRELRGIWPFRGTVPYRTVLQELNYDLTSDPPGSHSNRGAPELNEKGQLLPTSSILQTALPLYLPLLLLIYVPVHTPHI